MNPLFENLDYLSPFAQQIHFTEIQALRAERASWLERKSNAHYREIIAGLPSIHAKHQVFDEDMVQIGTAEEISLVQKELIFKALEAFAPWRKGPFSIFGIEIDAEWQSHWKWNRFLPHLASLAGKRVLDIGCNNGYYLYRMFAQNPAFVMGIDPTVRYYYTFALLQHFAQVPDLFFELLGVEHLHLFPKFFDTVFCMGILYHHPNPIQLLQGIHTCMKPGGQLLIESQGIAGEEAVALFPQKRYAKVPGTWFVPTATCLQHWLQRSGFREIEMIYAAPLTVEEQRSTPWTKRESLKDFLDPHDSSKTIEGYPAPHRFYFTARKTG